MMRWLLFSVAVIAVAAIATVGATYFVPDESSSPVPAVVERPSGPTGKVEVEGGDATYNFGTMTQRAEGKHEWTIVNKGSGPLKLSHGGVTCSCTNGSIKQGEPVTLLPGEKFPMVVTWNTKTWDKFHQVATVLVSNDPEVQRLEFTIDGSVYPPLVTMPPEGRLDFQTVSNDKPQPHAVGVGSVDRPETKVLAALANPAIFKTEVVPMTAEECAALKVTKGSKVVVSIRPGAPIGPFHEELVVTTDHPQKPEARFTMAGKVEGPIRFSPDRIRLIIPAKEGGSEDLTLWVRGKKETKFTVESKPENVDVRIEPIASAGEATQYRFTVTVPPGQRPGSHIEGSIVLKTDHPDAAEVKVPVSVIVRAS
jgi:hypothetical protein